MEKRKIVFICTSFDDAVSKSEHRPTASYFESKVMATKVSAENYIMRSLVICTPHPKLFG
jgi:hypothetical protein